MKLAKPVPVYWVYITAWAVADGVVNFRNDIYGLDGLEQYATAEGEPAPVAAGVRGGGTGAAGEGELTALGQGRRVEARRAAHSRAVTRLGWCMDISSLLIFAGVLAVAAGSPGPSIAALVTRVLARGPRDVCRSSGDVGRRGDLAVACRPWPAVIAETFHLLFAIIKYAGAADLLYLAWKMWRARVATTADGLPAEVSPARMFLAGMAVTLGNPKIMVFYMALLPTIIDLSHVSTMAWGELTATMVIVLVAVDFAWVLVAGQARRLLRSARAMRLANRTSATVVAGAAIAIATR